MSDDSYSEVTSESWFSRIGGAIKGILFGIVLFVIAFPLLWWNEGRAVHTAQGIQEAGGSLISVPADKVDPANDKKLVHVTGEATTKETLSDPAFGISLSAIKLQRRVEMYQWIEHESSETVKKIGGGTETKKTWTYDKGWSSSLIDSRKFNDQPEKQANPDALPEKHVNPDALRFSGESFVCKVATLGAFKLSPGLIGEWSSFEALPLDDKTLATLPQDLKEQTKLSSNSYFLPSDPKQKAIDPNKPVIGDLRVSFQDVRPGTVSILARQNGDTFESWQAKTGTNVERLQVGAVSAENMIGQMESENTTLTWILRGVGLALMAMGIGMVFQPLVVLTDVLPFLGNIVGMGVGLFAFLIALSLSLTTIAIAWLAYRPVFGIGLIVVAVGLLVGLKMLGRKKSAAGPGTVPAAA